jgi:hypothetical protein
MGFVRNIFRNAGTAQASRELERRARLTPPMADDGLPAYLQDIVEAVGNWEVNFEDLLRLAYRQYLDHLNATLEVIDEARFECALEGKQISDELMGRFPDLVRRSLSHNHPLTVALIEEGGR